MDKILYDSGDKLYEQFTLNMGGDNPIIQELYEPLFQRLGKKIIEEFNDIELKNYYHKLVNKKFMVLGFVELNRFCGGDPGKNIRDWKERERNKLVKNMLAEVENSTNQQELSIKIINSLGRKVHVRK